MAPIDQKQRAERRMLQLVADTGLPRPDEIEYGHNCVRFLWREPRVAVVVDLTDFDETERDGGYDQQNVAA